MKKPNKLVALCVNISGGCEYVALVKNITESEYAELLYKQRQHEQERQSKERITQAQIDELVEQVRTLKHEIKVLKGEDEDEESTKD